MEDLRDLISSIRSSLVVTESDEEGKQAKRPTLAETKTSSSEGSKSRVSTLSTSSTEKGKQVEEAKVPSKDTNAHQKGGYQSFFQRPSTLIYGLTAKSSNKSTSKKDKEGKRADTNKQKDEERRKSERQTDDLEKKQIGCKHSQSSSDKGVKSSKKGVKSDCKQKENNKPDENHRFSDEIGLTSAIKRDFPRFSTENLPMMDEDKSEKPSEKYGISHVSISVNSPNYNLEKSLSSPSVTAKFSDKKLTRPNVLNIPPSKEGNGSHSNTSSPESPIFPPSLSSSQKSSEVKYVSESFFPSQRSPSFSPVVRQSSLPSVPEKRPNANSRPGVFAIARQKSSPNIPVQRQSSTPSYPIQRQRSLGTVPEEGQLPRQASLMSVPEDRPIVDQTLPISPSSSMVSFGLSPSPSGDALDSYRERYSVRNSMELVTGPVVSGSLLQESCARQLPPSSEFEMDQLPVATSSLKKTDKRKKENSGPVIV